MTPDRLSDILTEVLTLASANTQYAFTVPRGTNRLRIQARTAVDIRISWSPGRVSTPTDPYWTIKSGTVFEIGPLSMGDRPLYFGSAGTSVVVEIEVAS